MIKAMRQRQMESGMKAAFKIEKLKNGGKKNEFWTEPF